jgi:hypothetical protein
MHCIVKERANEDNGCDPGSVLADYDIDLMGPSLPHETEEF